MQNFLNFFQEVAKTIGVSGSFDMSNYSHSYPVNNGIRKYQSHASVKQIHETITVSSALIKPM